MNPKDAAGIAMLLAVIALCLARCETSNSTQPGKANQNQSVESETVKRELAELRELIRKRKEMDEKQKQVAGASGKTDEGKLAKPERQEDSK
jgi:hypothetical protein